MNYLLEKKNILFLIIAAVYLIAYILFLGSYPLLDVDETRYVDMASNMLKTGDFMTLYLNGAYFFEKPPLFFWVECLSFKFFGVSELSARLPIVLLSLLPLGFLFGLCNKVKGVKFAFITSLILLTTLEYGFLTKIAILDSVMASFSASSVLSYFFTFFVDDKNKKWFWILTYAFMGLAVMAKGLPGIVIPLGIIFISSIIFKSFKETFKYSLLGLIIFLIIALPWHIIMIKTYPHLFFHEYIYKHHILRFIGSASIDRNHPWYFYIVTIIWGLTPYTLMLIGLKNIKIKSDKLLTLNTIAVLFIFLFFSISKSKLITYILPIYPFLAVILGQIWYNYIEKDDKYLKFALLFLNIILAIGGLGFPFVASYLMHTKVTSMLVMHILFVLFSIILIRSIIKNERFNSFLYQCILMSLILGFATPVAMKLDYSFGQNDLIKFAQIAKENNYSISTYKTGFRYSLLYYSDLNTINFHNLEDKEWLKNELKKKNNYIIIKNKEIKYLPKEAKVTLKGVKYSAVVGVENGQ